VKKILVAVCGLATAAVLAACSSTTTADVQPVAANASVPASSDAPTSTTPPTAPPASIPAPSAPKPTADRKPKAAAPRAPAAVGNGTPCRAVTTGACVSLSMQKAWLLQDGKVVYGPVPIKPGSAAYPTPTGTFDVLSKEKVHYSTEFNNAPMPNSVFFYPGDAFHTGSLSVPSHGCIHLSSAASLKFFTTLQVGQTVQVLK